jgi:hypothetical protein
MNHLRGGKKLTQHVKNNIDQISLLLEEIDKAKSDWVCAQAQYEEAIEWDQVDHAIYNLKATEKKYSLLIKQAKKMYRQRRID